LTFVVNFLLGINKKRELPMENVRKAVNADLRKYYTIFFEIGVIIVLLLFITAMKVDFRTDNTTVVQPVEQEIIEMEEVIQTKQEERPPPPPRPQVPVEVPNDEIIEEQDIQLNVEFDIDEPLDMPPPPEEEDEEDFFIAVEEMPELVGGQKWLYEQIRYPELARKAGIEGRVVVQFVVNPEGEPEDLKILRGIGGGCNEEAMRVIREANFKPGRQRGVPVPVQMALTIVFRLQN
jgi:protein TonB